MALGNFLTTSEAAAIVGVNDSRIRQLHKAGRLKGQKIGTQLFFDKSHIKDFAKQDRPPGRPKES